ncbi:T9SS type A sorting domain-containing protein [Bizionia myxarmorum]|uniref:T9SS type A sorting domain-containing protein n=1 Tax=Bizionia myxarmorum TaxID=291186 RepID=A0A5D0R6Z7_9FLAO|nr:T9SS type A sorting domain-containing protein [Bizionia myxarmorum]TYB76448.1 T9SS type A sorting domain-containing protein [Bizionia myxarmorum]
MKQLENLKRSLVFLLFILLITSPELAQGQEKSLIDSNLKTTSFEDENSDRKNALQYYKTFEIPDHDNFAPSNSVGYEIAYRTSQEYSSTFLEKGQVRDFNLENELVNRGAGDFIVNTTDDTVDANIADTACADSNGNCSLRAAIQNANKSSDKNTIYFDISGTAPFTIVIGTSELPTVIYPIVIDGRTQTEYLVSNSPVIEIDGSSLPINNSGLKIYGLANNSEIYGLSIGGFQMLDVSPFTGGFGIDVYTNNNIIQGNYIGLKPDGNTFNRNYWGIFFLNSSNNSVGGTGAYQGNVISSNLSGGITFQGLECTNNTVQGNLVGTDATGLLPRGNRFNLQLIDAPNNIIGGNTPAARNIFSAGENNQNAIVDGTGISMKGASAINNTITGNYFGTDITGNLAFPNVRAGILLVFGPNNNTIGGTGPGEGNVISGNNQGIYFQGSESGNPVSNNTILGNYIGTNAAGNMALPNTVGILMGTGENNLNTIGGPTSASRNIISGNTFDGISISNGEANTIKNNYMGLDALGTGLLGNGQAGIYINSANNVIDTNVLSGNSVSGIYLGSSSTTNQITANFIGTDSGGLFSIPNGKGIENRGANNTIGGTTALQRNIISGNAAYGINIFGDAATGNSVTGNYIGTDITGTLPIPNNIGLRILESSSNIVGGSLVSERNIISGNSSDGVLIASELSINNQVLGNYIGTDVTGTSSVSNFRGLRMTNTLQNTIGGPGLNDGNVISGNLSDGVLLLVATNNTLFGNKIGVQADGSSALGNGQTGVQILNGSSNNTFGGLNSGEGNIVAFNVNKGIGVFKVSLGGYPDIEPIGNIISGNSMFSNLSNVSPNGISSAGIDLNSDGISINDAGDADLGANNTQNYPVIGANSATVDEAVITLSYLIPSAAANSAYPIQVEFFIDDNNRQAKEFLFVDTYSEADYNLGINKTISKAVPSGSSFAADQKIVAIAIDANGNTSECSQSEIVIEESLSIDYQVLETVSIYPNPVSGILNIRTSQDIRSVALYDMLGKTIIQETNAKQLDLSNYQSGIYLLKIVTDKGEITKKIVIK